MRQIIHNVRQKPEKVRRQILHGATALFAVVLFLLWVVSLGGNFKDEKAVEKTAESLKPLSALKANIIDGYYSLTQ